MRRIALTQGKFALVDDDDFERVSRLAWHAYLHHGIWYAKHTTSRQGGRQRTVRLHHFVLQLSVPYPQIDHKNRDGLDCQKHNLRRATTMLNRGNSVTHPKSGFKGVYLIYPQYPRPWQATIRINGRNKSLGYFATAEEAARAYDVAALNHFGEFARPNFVTRMG